MPPNFPSRPGALALPMDDDGHPDRSPSPMWRRQSDSSRNPLFNHRSEPTTFWGRISQQSQLAIERVDATYRKFTPLQRILLSVAGVLTIILGILFLVYGEKMFKGFIPVAQKWRELKGGWAILWVLTFVVSLPPLIGYSTCVTLAGVIYGVSIGWVIVATATVAGSTASFVVSRTVLSKYVQRLVANDKRFAALALTLKSDGLKLLVMIRLCPLPYSLCNGAIATFPTVSWAKYGLATAIVTPKLLIPVFVGTRIGAIVEHGGEMDFKTKLINYLSIIFGVTLGIVTALIIYKQTQKRAAKLEQEEAERAFDTPSPNLSRDYSDDPENSAADAIMDDISLHTNEGHGFTDESDNMSDAQEVRSDRFRDLMSDDEDDDVFRKGDGDTDDEGGDLGRYRA